MEAPHFPEVTTWETRQALYMVWERLPSEVCKALADVQIREAPTANYADAGPRDIRIRPGLWYSSTFALMGVLAHELGHVAGAHYQRVEAKAMTAEDAEREADAYARSWGFGDELRTRRMFMGK